MIPLGGVPLCPGGAPYLISLRPKVEGRSLWLVCLLRCLDGCSVGRWLSHCIEGPPSGSLVPPPPSLVLTELPTCWADLPNTKLPSLSQPASLTATLGCVPVKDVTSMQPDFFQRMLRTCQLGLAVTWAAGLRGGVQGAGEGTVWVNIKLAADSALRGCRGLMPSQAGMGGWATGGRLPTPARPTILS